LLGEETNTGRKLRDWMKRQGLTAEPVMQLDSFDLIINLVALGMGVSLVPIRALALYGRKRALHRLPWKERFVRELVVVMRRHRKFPIIWPGSWRTCFFEPKPAYYPAPTLSFLLATAALAFESRTPTA